MFTRYRQTDIQIKMKEIIYLFSIDYRVFLKKLFKNLMFRNEPVLVCKIKPI